MDSHYQVIVQHDLTYLLRSATRSGSWPQTREVATDLSTADRCDTILHVVGEAPCRLQRSSIWEGQHDLTMCV